MTAILDILPLIFFFIAYKFYGLWYATLSLLIATPLTLLVSYLKTKKLNRVNIFTSSLVIMFSSFTLYFNDMSFIKMKPTIINAIFGSILLIGILKKKALLQSLLGSAIKMQESAWLTLSKRWCTFFFASAILNEFIWRNFSEQTWVQFKVFGSIAITFTFIMLNLPFIMRHSQAVETLKK